MQPLKKEKLTIHDFPQENFRDVCCRYIELIEQNRAYLDWFMLDNGDKSRAQAALEDIRAASMQLYSTFNEMLALLDCVHGAAKPNSGIYSLYDLLMPFAAHANDVKRGLDISLTFDTGEWTFFDFYAKTDPEWFQNICMHLLSNAMRACSRGGAVSMALERRGGDIVFSVSDNGCGLPDRGRGNEVENLRRFYGGAGAGLMLCSEYCRILSWDMELTGAAGGGTRAALTIPASSMPQDSSTFRSPDSRASHIGSMNVNNFFDRQISIILARRSTKTNE